MKITTLIEQLADIAKRGDNECMQAFWEKDWEGTCPCFFGCKTVEGKRICVHGKCWRVSKNAQDLYVWGNCDDDTLMKIAKQIKKALDAQKWYNKYTIIIGDPDVR